MATSKLLKPTNVTISIPEFTDQPDQRVNSNCIDKEADAINSLSDHIALTESFSASSYITANNGTISSGGIDKNIKTCMLGVVLSGVSITSGVELLTIADGYGIRPKRPLYISVFNYDDGKPFNGCLYFTNNGKMTYYGDSISNKNIYVCATYIGES